MRPPGRNRGACGTDCKGGAYHGFGHERCGVHAPDRQPWVKHESPVQFDGIRVHQQLGFVEHHPMFGHPGAGSPQAIALARFDIGDLQAKDPVIACHRQARFVPVFEQAESHVRGVTRADGKMSHARRVVCTQRYRHATASGLKRFSGAAITVPAPGFVNPEYKAAYCPPIRCHRKIRFHALALQPSPDCGHAIKRDGPLKPCFTPPGVASWNRIPVAAPASNAASFASMIVSPRPPVRVATGTQP